ncbi:MAG: hypothetical protein EBS95_08960 [Chitinophagia bacterium]|nr:hypothetical protein [Chitinophagia bacterium]
MDRKEFLSQIGIGGAGLFAAACLQACSKSSAAPSNVDLQLDLSTPAYASLKTPCTAHNSVFTSTGERVSGPTPRGLTQYKTSLTGNILRVYS